MPAEVVRGSGSEPQASTQPLRGLRVTEAILQLQIVDDGTKIPGATPAPLLCRTVDGGFGIHLRGVVRILVHRIRFRRIIFLRIHVLELGTRLFRRVIGSVRLRRFGGRRQADEPEDR